MEGTPSDGHTDADVRPQVPARINTITTVAMTAFHMLAVAAFFFIDWGAIATAVVLYFAAGMLGIGMAYRLLTHRSYKTTKWVEYFLTWCGTLALEGGPIFWVATHRVHHQKSDLEGDPHTPREGTWWAHMGWIIKGSGLHHDASVVVRYAGSVRATAFTSGSKWHWTSNVVVGLILLAVGESTTCSGDLLQDDRRPSRHVAGELRDAQVGFPPLQDQGRFDEQLVGRCHDLRRRLAAQQPPRPSNQRPSRPGLVRDRPELDGHQHLEGARAGVGHQAGEDQAAAARRNARRAGGGSSRVRSLHDPSPEGDRLLHHALRPARRRGDPAQRLLGRLHRNAGRQLIVGILLFALIIAGIIVYTVFLVMEIKRNEDHGTFINAVTHELKTPLASIRLYLDTLKTRPVADPQRQEFYDVMLADVERLRHTVDQVLKAGVVREKQRAAIRTQLDIGLLARECVDLAVTRHHLPPGAIALEAHDGASLMVRGDAEPAHGHHQPAGQRRQVFRQRRPSDRLARGAGPDTIWVRVQDRGVGIPRKQLKRIFNRFYRVQARGFVRSRARGSASISSVRSRASTAAVSSRRAKGKAAAPPSPSSSRAPRHEPGPRRGRRTAHR